MSYDKMKSIANYDAISEYFGQDYSQIVPALVKAWDDAPTIKLKDSVCRSEAVQQVTTPTTLSVFYKLSFEKVIIMVQKIFVAEEYDGTGTQDHISIVDDLLLIVGIEPIV